MTATHSASQFFRVSMNVLIGIGFLSLASTGKLDALSWILFAPAYAIYFTLALQQREGLLSPKGMTRLTQWSAVLFLLDWTLWSRDFVYAAIHLLILIQAIKFFSAKKDRDFFYLLLIAFMELLAAAALTVSTLFFLSFSLFLLVLIAALMSFEMKRAQEAGEAEKKDVAPYSSGGLRARDADRQLPRALASSALLLSIGILLLSSAIFFALPRLRGGFFSRWNASVQTISGFSETVHFGDIGSIKQNPAVVMRVRVEDDDYRKALGLYWRGITLDHFDGRTWTRKPRVSQLVPPRVEDMVKRSHQQSEAKRSQLLYRVILEPVTTTSLFVARPVVMVGGVLRVAVDETDSYSTELHPFSRVRYTVISDLRVPAATDLRNAFTNYPENIRRDYLQLPNLDPRIGALAREVTQTSRTAYDRAKAIEDYLRKKFGYSLELPAVAEDDPLAEFLFHRKKGHCEYFASSMAVMLRSLGIPARLVNGFQTGEYNALGKDFIVRELDAHSWVEVFFPGHGWVAFDPTPPAPARTPTMILATLSHYLDAFELFWNDWVVSYDPFRQFTLWRSAQSKTAVWKMKIQYLFRRWGRSVERTLEGWFFQKRERWWSAWSWRDSLGMLTALTGMGLVVLALFVYRKSLRFRWAPHAEAPLVTALYTELQRHLRRFGLEREPHETPLEFAASLDAHPLGDSVARFTRLYQRLRFGPPAETSELLQLKQQLQQIKNFRR